MIEMIKIRSATDSTVSLYDPTIPLRKVFEKRGAIAIVEKDKLIQAYFNSSLETALRSGQLIIDDKNFLYEVGYITDMEEEVQEVELTTNLMKRCIGVMPVAELQTLLKKLSRYQIQELAEYAIENRNELKLDRVELLSKISGKNILKAIELRKAEMEE